jgi:hypothetical protein
MGMPKQTVKVQESITESAAHWPASSLIPKEKRYAQ